MSEPTIEAYLSNLYRMKWDCLGFISEAEKRGDVRETIEFKEHLERIESMIEMKGGDPDAYSRIWDSGKAPI